MTLFQKNYLLPYIMTASAVRYVQYPADFSGPLKQLLIDGAKLSWMAYSEPKIIDAEYKREDKSKLAGAFEVLNRVSEPPKFVTCIDCDAQAYLVRYQPPAVDNLQSKPVLAICARGTTSVMDWICNAQVYQTKLKDCNGKLLDVQVHAGFYRQFISLFSMFDEAVKKHLRDGGSLFCTGHSLGGGISTIAALNYASGFPNQVWQASYGSPRVGDAKFASLFDKIVQTRIRTKNSSDPVPAIIPPIDYVHVGCEAHLGPPDNYPEIPVLTDSGDHSISKYVDGLQVPEKAKETAPSATKSWLQRTLDSFRWSPAQSS